MILYYSDQCPHAEKYAEIVRRIAEEKNVALKLIKFNTAAEAQSAKKPFTTYSLFDNGEFITNEIVSEKKFIKLLKELRER